MQGGIPRQAPPLDISSVWDGYNNPSLPPRSRPSYPTCPYHHCHAVAPDLPTRINFLPQVITSHDPLTIGKMFEELSTSETGRIINNIVFCGLVALVVFCVIC